MSRKNSRTIASGAALFDRVASILEEARANVVRSVNANMVLAYWLIGREIVLELQAGDERAEYGKQLLQELSRNLKEKYGSGFSVTSLQDCRKFYQAYPDRMEIQHPTGAEFTEPETLLEITRPMGAESRSSFSPHLSWSHYRALMRVKKPEAREFYEQEAIACGWDKRSLERHIHSQYYERLLGRQNQQQMLKSARRGRESREAAGDTLKNPYVLEFLGLPQAAALQESQLEAATMVVAHLTYNPVDDRHKLNEIFTVDKKADFSRAVKTKRHVYDYVFTDSDNERKFVTTLDTSTEVVVYAKLPKGFFIPTPVGSYNPDWAIVFKEGAVKHIYFVAETKGSMSSLELRAIEISKIDCARKFFAGITSDQVKYDVVDSYDKLMDLAGCLPAMSN